MKSAFSLSEMGAIRRFWGKSDINWFLSAEVTLVVGLRIDEGKVG